MIIVLLAETFISAGVEHQAGRAIDTCSTKISRIYRIGTCGHLVLTESTRSRSLHA